MDFQTTSKTLEDVTCDALVVGAARSKTASNTHDVVLSGMTKEVDTLLDGLISQICADGAFKGNLGEMTTVYTIGKLAAKRVLVVGLGSIEALNAQALRKASAISVRHLQQNWRTHNSSGISS